MDIFDMNLNFNSMRKVKQIASKGAYVILKKHNKMHGYPWTV